MVYGSSAGQQTNEKTQQKLGFFSVPGGIRTCDLRFRKPTLYPAELRGHAHCLDAQSTLTDYEFQLPILCLRSRTERPSSGFTSTPQKPSLTDQRSQMRSRKLHLRSSLSGFAHAEPAQQGKIGCRCQSFLDQSEILRAAAGCSLMRLAKIARDTASVPGRTQPLKRKRHHPSAHAHGSPLGGA